MENVTRNGCHFSHQCEICHKNWVNLAEIGENECFERDSGIGDSPPRTPNSPSSLDTSNGGKLLVLEKNDLLLE